MSRCYDVHYKMFTKIEIKKMERDKENIKNKS